MQSPTRTKSFRMDTVVDVAFSGSVHSYTYFAAKAFFAPYTSNANFNSVENVKALFQSVLDGEATYGVTPLESSSYGTIHAVYDRLLTSQGSLQIVGELGQIEEHCLCISSKFSSASDFDIERISSHPHIIECCSDFLDALDARRANLGRPPMQRDNVWDSAIGCQVANESQVVTACICSKEAADAQNLRILHRTIGNYKNAETRYVIIARAHPKDESVVDPLNVRHPREGMVASAQHRPKCSIAMNLRNIPGAIFKMSSCFAFRNLDIIKIESRPATISMQLDLPAEKRPFTQKHWDLIFYIDYEPSENPEVNAALFNNLSEYCLWIKRLGTYQAGLHSLDQQRSEWSLIQDTVAF